MLMRISDSTRLALTPCVASYRAWDISSAGTAIISQKLFSVTRVPNVDNGAGRPGAGLCFIVIVVLMSLRRQLRDFVEHPLSHLPAPCSSNPVTLVEDGHLAVFPLLGLFYVITRTFSKSCALAIIQHWTAYPRSGEGGVNPHVCVWV